MDHDHNHKYFDLLIRNTQIDSINNLRSTYPDNEGEFGIFTNLKKKVFNNSIIKLTRTHKSVTITFTQDYSTKNFYTRNNIFIETLTDKELNNYKQEYKHWFLVDIVIYKDTFSCKICNHKGKFWKYDMTLTENYDEADTFLFVHASYNWKRFYNINCYDTFCLKYLDELLLLTNKNEKEQNKNENIKKMKKYL